MGQTAAMVLGGACAGAVAGLFGAGGGMVLVPLLTLGRHIPEEEVFPTSLSVMVPVCLVCLAASAEGLPWAQAAPYLAGSALGGIPAGLLGKKIPVNWLHRGLGILILWGGWRYLWG